jgi:hypothetical protein
VASGYPEVMSQPDEARCAENQTAPTAQDRLRTELLTSGLDDLVPLAEVESVITGQHLAATTADQQELALSVVRSLIADGLMEFEGWDDVPLNEAMARVHELFVTHYEDPGSWAFAIWLKLTETGKRIATELKAKAPDEACRAENQTALNAQDRLRTDLFNSGLCDLIPLSLTRISPKPFRLNKIRLYGPFDRPCKTGFSGSALPRSPGSEAKKSNPRPAPWRR